MVDADIDSLVGVGRWVMLGVGELPGAGALAVGWSPSPHAKVREAAIKVRQTMKAMNHADRLCMVRLAVLSNTVIPPSCLDQWPVQCDHWVYASETYALIQEFPDVPTLRKHWNTIWLKRLVGPDFEDEGDSDDGEQLIKA